MLENLSPREREIFNLLLEGIPPKEIANRLNVSYSTVDFHRTKLYGKLGVHSIQELFAKYSTNGKTPPAESEADLPLSGTNMQKRFKLLLLVGIALLVFSVLLLLIFIKKSSAHSKPKGVMIPINLMSFRPWSDEYEGGNSTSEISVTREEIDGVIIDSVLTLKTNLVRREDTDTIYANAQTRSYYVINQLRNANGIRFKARGDGKSWYVGFHTTETIAETKYAHYRFEFGTIRDQVVFFDIPYSSLFLPEWYGCSFDFKKETINLFTIETALSVQSNGSSFLQIFDFEIY
jgi:DNA-binding CsgD family transcriptional regulator